MMLRLVGAFRSHDPCGLALLFHKPEVIVVYPAPAEAKRRDGNLVYFFCVLILARPPQPATQTAARQVPAMDKTGVGKEEAAAARKRQPWRRGSPDALRQLPWRRQLGITPGLSLEGHVRILQIITPHKIAGAERSTTSLCEHLVRAGHEVIVACRREHPLIPVMREVGLDVRGISIGGKFNLAAPLRLARLARRERVDIINTQLSTAALWGSLAGHLTGIPTVATVRALNNKSFYMLAHRVIAVSQAVRDYLMAQGMRGDRIDVVYNGIDPGRYRLTLTRAAARERLGLEEEAIVFAVVGHLSARKGHAVFLDAAARIADQAADHLYVFAGEGLEGEHLQRQARRLALADRVTFTGFLPDIMPIYAAADVVVLPSIAGEGLPRVLLEAGLLGRPAIGTRLSGTPEIIAEGVTGFIVPPGDVPALADAMLRLAGEGELRARMGAAAAARISCLFTIPAMVEGTLASYQRVLGRQAPGGPEGAGRRAPGARPEV